MIKSEVFDLLKIDLDIFTYDTPLGMIFDEFERLSNMEDNLFTYELEVVDEFYFPCIEQPHDNLTNDDFDVYEPRVCYDENEQIYAEAVIPINKRLVRLIDVTVEQLLDLKFTDHRKIKMQLEVYGLYTDVKCDPSNVDFAEWLASKYSNHMTMDWYTKNALLIYWIRGDDEEVLTDEELYDLEEEKHSRNSIILSKLMWTYSREIYLDSRHMKIIRMRGSTNRIEKSRGLKRNHGWIMEFGKSLLMILIMFTGHTISKVDTLNGQLVIGKKMGIGKKEEEESSDDNWSHYSPINKWKDYEHTTYIETDVNSNQNTYNNVCQISKEHAGMTNDDAIHGDHEWFDEHEPMEDDDDIDDLDDYLIMNDVSYFIDEEKERSKERWCKLLGIPYVKPPTCKSEKFEVIKNSSGPVKEYVAIKEYEYDIWLQTKENMSQVYKETFCKKDEGWIMVMEIDTTTPTLVTTDVGPTNEGENGVKERPSAITPSNIASNITMNNQAPFEKNEGIKIAGCGWVVEMDSALWLGRNPLARRGNPYEEHTSAASFPSEGDREEKEDTVTKKGHGR
ncbi:hypothetical protein Tco_0085300 [Tanacetum coccineum]